MARNSTRVVLAISVVLVARIVLSGLANPMDVVRADLARDVALADSGVALDGWACDYAALQHSIAARPALWKELVEAPSVAVEAPASVVKPDKPDLAAMLKGVKIDRGQIGEDKIRVITPEAPKGQWLAVGTVIKGCTLSSFSADGVTFTYHGKDGGQEFSLTLPRP